MQGGVEEGLLGPGEDGEAATVLPACAEQQDLLVDDDRFTDIFNISLIIQRLCVQILHRR